MSVKNIDTQRELIYWQTQYINELILEIEMSEEEPIITSDTSKTIFNEKRAIPETHQQSDLISENDRLRRRMKDADETVRILCDQRDAHRSALQEIIRYIDQFSKGSGRVTSTILSVIRKMALDSLDEGVRVSSEK